MARFSGFLLFFSILLVLTLLTTSVVESSPPLSQTESSPPLSQTVAESKITIGSSISAATATITDSNTSFWLSPSGLFSFGFYPLNAYHQDYIIGIWINNNPTQKTLVWSINRDDSPLSNATSLLLNHDGKFVIIQFSNGTKEKPLFHQADSLLSSPISYASLLDNGNLVFYNSNSTTIIWESFGYPTDTILPNGQTLHPEQSLVSSVSESDRSSGKYKMIMKNDGNLMIYRLGSPVELKGHLYLGDWNGVIRKYMNKGSSIDKGGEQDKVIYRATLGNDGVFRLYKEKIDDENASTKEKKIHTVVVWDTKEKISNQDDPEEKISNQDTEEKISNQDIFPIIGAVVLIVSLLLVILI